MVIILIDELIKYQVIDLNKLVLKIYPKLGLLPQEGVMLLHLLSFYQQNNMQKNFPLSYVALKNKTGMDKKENGNLIKSLEDKGFLESSVEELKTGKLQECINVSNAIIKIEELLMKEKTEDEEKQIQQALKEVISLFENELSRTLSPVEISLLDENKKKYSKSDYENAIFEVSKKQAITIKKCINYLNTSSFMNKDIDKADEESIKGFLAKLNK